VRNIKKFEGLHTYRFAQNPTELAATESWAKQHLAEGYGTLEYLLGDGATPVVPSERDWLVAGTVIQWLGSPIGRGFLQELRQKFEIIDAKERGKS
jgi:hypothetical protein